MENFLNNAEKAPIEKQEVINRLKDYGKEDAVTTELLQNWIQQHKNEIRTIADPKEQRKADFSFEIEKIKVYIETGFLDEAWEELYGNPDEGIEGMLDAASNDEEAQIVNDLLDEIERIRDSRGE